MLEKEVCVYGEGDAAVTFLPSILAKLEVKLAGLNTYIGQNDNMSIRNAGIMTQKYAKLMLDLLLCVYIMFFFLPLHLFCVDKLF